MDNSKSTRAMKRMYTMSTALMKIHLFLVAAAAFANGGTDSSKEALVARIKNAEPAAMVEAGNSGDKSFISFLEAQTSTHYGPAISPKVYDQLSPRQKKEVDFPLPAKSSEAAKMALAKLGVKKYLDEAVAELTTTNSALFQAYKVRHLNGASSEESAVERAKYDAQEQAFEKLAYINDPSAIKFIGPFLYDTRTAPFRGTDFFLATPAQLAVLTLRKMIQPLPSDANGTLDADDIRAWQQWWEQNKDKYP
jgi:hypothetical protein